MSIKKALFILFSLFSILSFLFIFKTLVAAESVTLCNYCEHYSCRCNQSKNPPESECYISSETNHLGSQYTSTCTPSTPCGKCDINNCHFDGACTSGGGGGGGGSSPTNTPTPTPRHKGCVGTGCAWVAGTGTDQCSTVGNDPAPQCSRRRCSSGQCITIADTSDTANACDVNSDCWFKKCSGTACVEQYVTSKANDQDDQCSNIGTNPAPPCSYTRCNYTTHQCEVAASRTEANQCGAVTSPDSSRCVTCIAAGLSCSTTGQACCNAPPFQCLGGICTTPTPTPTFTPTPTPPSIPGCKLAGESCGGLNGTCCYGLVCPAGICVTPTPIPGTSNSPTPTSGTPTPTPIGGSPWIKLKDTAFAGVSVLDNVVPASPIKFDADDPGNPYFIDTTTGSDPGEVSAQSIDTGSSQVSTKDWKATGLEFKPETRVSSFIEYIFARKNYKNITGEPLSTAINSGDTIYYAKGDQTISDNGTLNQSNIILVVDGNLTISHPQINPSQRSIAVLVKGNLTLSPTVRELDGIFIVQGTVDTGTNTQGLKVVGNLISQGSLTNDRSQPDNHQPSIFIVFSPDTYFDLLPYLSIRTYNWKQLPAPGDSCQGFAAAPTPGEPTSTPIPSSTPTPTPWDPGLTIPPYEGGSPGFIRTGIMQGMGSVTTSPYKIACWSSSPYGGVYGTYGCENGNFPLGTPVYIYATPAPGWVFVGWTGPRTAYVTACTSGVLYFSMTATTEYDCYAWFYNPAYPTITPTYTPTPRPTATPTNTPTPTPLRTPTPTPTSTSCVGRGQTCGRNYPPCCSPYRCSSSLLGICR